MIRQMLDPFNNVVATGKATVKFPYLATLNRVVLTLGGGSFTRAMIAALTLKIGSRKVWEMTGPRLQAYNDYKGVTAAADVTHLSIDFMERDAVDLRGQLIGCYDLTQFKDDLSLEVDIAGATTPTLAGEAWLDSPQGNPLIQKLVRVQQTFAASGEDQVLQFNPQGAIIKRAFMFHTGNMTKFEVRKNGGVIYDKIARLDAEYSQKEFRKVPQTNCYVWDPIIDNNADNTVRTADARNMTFKVSLSAADTVDAYFELIDAPNNV